MLLPYLKYFETLRLMSRVTLVSLITCVSFKTLWAQAGGVVFVFVFSGLMEVLQHFSPPPAPGPGRMWR